MMLLRTLGSTDGQTNASSFGSLSGSRIHAGMSLQTPSNSQNPPGIRFIQEKDPAAVGLRAAEYVAAQLAEKPDSSIVFPTGNTPLPMYKVLRHWPHLQWQRSRLFHLDEYIAPAFHRAPLPYETYEDYMRRELWDYINAKKHFFGHYAQNPQAYEALVLAENGPDLVILGIGSNGHIAFNEPGSTQDAPSRLIDLTEETILANFGASRRKDCPTQAVTLGMKAILSARRILLLATGTGKRAVIARAFDPTVPPSADCPASWLQLHSDVTVLTDFVV